MSATDWKLEVIPVPVADIDQATRFYRDGCGFTLDLDVQVNPSLRVVQLTPPRSGCSIQLTNWHDMKPGSLRGLQVVVGNLETARQELLGRGVTVSPVRHMENGIWIDGPGDRWNSFAFFSDPDGNSWVLQERPAAEQAST
jgi:catechol 2,3-dioxygenase-like lactoylglutathione lyase family enzyme